MVATSQAQAKTAELGHQKDEIPVPVVSVDAWVANPSEHVTEGWGRVGGGVTFGLAHKHIIARVDVEVDLDVCMDRVRPVITILSSLEQKHLLGLSLVGVTCGSG